jgi:gentisate 1,2-dioxygenase
MNDRNDFHARMSAADVMALWELGHDAPPREAGHLWRWQDMSPLLDACVEQTTMDTAERRVLVLNNPAHAGTAHFGAAKNLAVCLQILMPGERARPHRHTMHALRFVLEADQVTTTVEGKRCEMLPGDMVLTPGMCWHEHEHRGKGRAVWVDALDVPFQAYMRNPVFEPGPVHDLVPLPPDAAFGGAGLGTALPVVSTPYSPLFRYPWEAAVQALAALPRAADGSRRVRYTNPMTGGAVMATLDCYLLGLEKGRDTRGVRSNANVACVVAEGEGASTIGEQTIRWSRNDIFTLPQGEWASHKAATADAKLFQITDREILRRLDLLREETQS